MQSPERIATLKWLLDKLSKAEDHCKPYFDRAKRFYRLYRFGSAIDDDDWPYINRTRTRDIFAFVEDSTANMVQTLLGTMPFFSVIPRKTSQLMQQHQQIDPIKIGKQIEVCLDQQISHEDTEFFEEITDYFKDGGIFGNAYLGVYPKIGGNRYLGPLLKTVGFWDVLPVTSVRRLSRAKGVFVREFMGKDEAMELAETVGLEGALTELGSFAGGGSVEKKWHEDLLAEVGIKNYNPSDDDIEILHYFSGGHVITIANRAVIIRDSREPIQNALGEPMVIKPFPYDQPIVQYKYIPVPGEFFGMGIPESLEVLQEDKNLIRSARRDNIDLVIHKILKARAGADINYDLIQYYAGAIWPMENLTDIEVLDQPDVSASAYNEEDKIQFDMENALSMFGYARGMTPTHEERPTTVIKLQQAAMNRLDLAIKLAEFGVLQNIATRIILLTRRYMSQQEYEAIIGDRDAGFYQLSEADIRRFYLFKPMGSSVTHVKEIRQQQIAAASAILERVAPVAMSGPEPFVINWYEAARAGLETLDIKNIEQIIIKIEQQQADAILDEQERKEMQMIAYGEDTKNVAKAKLEGAKTEGKIMLERVKQEGDKKNE